MMINEDCFAWLSSTCGKAWPRHRGVRAIVLGTNPVIRSPAVTLIKLTELGCR